MKYVFKAVVERVVIDDILLSVEADSDSEAFVMAEESLSSFPNVHEIPEVTHCYIENREYQSNMVLDLRHAEKQDFKDDNDKAS